MNSNKNMFEFMSNHITESTIYAAKAIAKVSMYIYQYRKDNHYSQKEFAEFMGVAQSMISKWESGEYNFTIENIAKIAEKLGVNFNIEFSPKDEYLYAKPKNAFEISGIRPNARRKKSDDTYAQAA